MGFETAADRLGGHGRRGRAFCSGVRERSNGVEFAPSGVTRVVLVLRSKQRNRTLGGRIRRRWETRRGHLSPRRATKCRCRVRGLSPTRHKTSNDAWPSTTCCGAVSWAATEIWTSSTPSRSRLTTEQSASMARVTACQACTSRSPHGSTVDFVSGIGPGTDRRASLGETSRSGTAPASISAWRHRQLSQPEVVPLGAPHRARVER